MKDKRIFFLLRLTVFLLVFSLFVMLAAAYRYAPGKSVGEKITAIRSGLSLSVKDGFPEIRGGDIMVGMLSSGLFYLLVSSKKVRKNYRPGEEYGSARWGRREDIAPFLSPIPEP